MPPPGQEDAAHVLKLQRVFCLSFVAFAIGGHSPTLSAEERKNWCLSSFPLAQFHADVSQLHSNFITETFAEIMIKTLASCNFKVIRDILACISFFFAITYQSSTWQAELPLFKQLTSLAARKALDLNLASPRRHVFFITFQHIMYTRHPVHLQHVMMTFGVYTGTVECFHSFD